LLLVLLPSLAFAQEHITDAKICEIESRPGDFAGKMVRVRGRVDQGFEWFFIEAKGCSLSLAYPNGPDELGAMATFQPSPEPQMPAKFQLLRDDNYRKFVAYANEVIPQKPECVCLGCYRYQVTVTMIGLFQLPKQGGTGFGHMNAARSRLVIRSVSEVEAIDVSNKSKDSGCGTPKLRLPDNPYPGWNQPLSVPPYPNSESNPK
jgi:hypothetical protein